MKLMTIRELILRNKLGEIAEEHGLSLVNIKGSVSAIGEGTIYLGTHNNEGEQIASFFHEIGHHIISRDFIKRVGGDKNGAFLIEVECWKIGFSLAEKYGYFFDDKIREYAKKCAETYFEVE